MAETVAQGTLLLLRKIHQDINEHLYNFSWILRAMETYHGMMNDSESNNDTTLDSLPPSKIMRLLYEVRMRIIFTIYVMIY